MTANIQPGDRLSISEEEVCTLVGEGRDVGGVGRDAGRKVGLGLLRRLT